MKTTLTALAAFSGCAAAGVRAGASVFFTRPLAMLSLLRGIRHKIAPRPVIRLLLLYKNEGAM